MYGVLPGSTIEMSRYRVEDVNSILTSIFLAGGLTLSQVSQLTGLGNYVVQNWVKRKFVPPPKNKRYSKRQFCRILIINMLKDCFRIDQIIKLLRYLNRTLDNEQDDRIDDSKLYLYICAVTANLDAGGMKSNEALVQMINDVLLNCKEEEEDVKERLFKVLRVIACAYTSSIWMTQAEYEVSLLDI